MKVFKYIFKKKLIIAITIVLLLVESICTFVTPYISSIAIDYGIQQGGIVFAAPLDLDAYSYRAAKLIASEEDQVLIEKSYSERYTDKQFFEGDEDHLYYEANIYGLSHIAKLEDVFLPILAYFQDNQEDIKIVDHLGKANQEDITLSEINSLRGKIAQYESSNDYTVMYKKAVQSKISENTYLGVDTVWYQINFMVFISLLMILVVVLYLVSCIIGTYLASKISYRISRDLRREQFKKVMSFSNHDSDKFSRASLITRATNDLQVVQNTSVFVIRSILIAPIMLIIGVVMAFVTAPSLVWLVGVAIAIILVLAIILISIVIPRYKLIQKIIDKVNSVARESISGVSIIRALNNEQFQEDRFSEVNKRLYHTMLFAMSMLVVAMPILMLVINILSISILWAGSFQLQAGVVNIGQLIAFISYSTETIFAFLTIAAGFVMLPRADVSIGRIEEVLTHKLKYDNFSQRTKKPKNLAKVDEFIKFEKVSFKYDEAKDKLFNNINLNIKKNSINAIVGPTGSGKSTILKLLLRFYDVSSGKILIDGINVKDYNEKDLRNKLSYVPQNVRLFKGTLKENVELNPDIKRGKKEVEESLIFANLWKFVESNKEGINYEVSQGARNLSGGQKQRITIARSIYENLPIMLLDDPFSSLDANTEKQINNALQNDYPDKTILVVTQRLSSVVGYDNIILIDEGKVSATGTHKQLMKTSKKYRDAFNKAKASDIEDMDKWEKK